MNKNKILIVGDSFAADNAGWPSMLNYAFENKAQRGVGEYKIYKQLENSTDFKITIICHSSPWRIHTRNHPIHQTNVQRSQNDFLLSDVEYHSKKNKKMKDILYHIENYIDFNYQEDIYNLLLKQMFNLKNTLHITFHDKEDTKNIPYNFNEIWKKFPGNTNHLNEEGNLKIAHEIKKLLEIKEQNE